MNGYNAFSGALEPEHICKYFDAVVKKERMDLPVQNSVHLNVVSETFVCCVRNMSANGDNTWINVLLFQIGIWTFIKYLHS